MKKFFLILSIALSALSVFAQSNILTVAVLDFDSKDENVADMGPKIATLVNAYLSADPNLITLERADIGKILSEQELGASGLVSTETAAKIGSLTGAKVLVTGRVFRADKDLFIVAKIVGTETSRVFGALEKGPAESASISDLSSDLAKQISKLIADKGETLVAKQESREDRIDKLAKSLKDSKHPSVSVKIEERHFGLPAIDPAAETELTAILQKTGFKVIDELSTNKPDIEITGQAFSAYGMRKGNLISCKSRIEIKAHERATGNLLLADSQTSVAVDIAEQTAAKTALENAAVDLSERLLPKLSAP
ncbi:MAG TPA: CsgG/HfaB family protein [Verrucomicrobiae bacterium]|jgi:hypothetical protein|nr:CsgG/HfaB family protein [Verrucomicrobiae bacterium]